MSSIDERVVEMQFDNKRFEAGVDQTMQSITKLNKALEFQNGTQGLDRIEAMASKFDLSGIAKAVDSISDRFSTLGIIGMRVIQNLTDSAMRFVSSAFSKVTGFVYEGLITRGLGRARNIEQARFQLMGLLKDANAVQAVMNDVDWSVQNTAYGLDEAALAASQFAASGLTAGTQMQHALRGIAGVAAMTNSEYSDISRIFTTIAGNGRVMTMELNQLAGRGLNAAATLAEVLGKTEQEVREMVSKGQISFEMFSDAMYEAFGEHATDAQKTLSGAFANARAAFAQIGQKFFAPFLAEESALVKFFQEVRTQVRKVRDGIGDFATFVTGHGLDAITAVVEKMQSLSFTAEDVSKFFEGLMKWITDFSTISSSFGRSFGRIFESVRTNVIGPFKEMIPFWIQNRGINLPWTPVIDFFERLKNLQLGDLVYFFSKLATDVDRFLSSIQPSSRELRLFGDIFEGFFSAIDIGRMAFSGIIDGFKTLFGYLTPYVGPVANAALEFFAGVGRAITRLRDAISESSGVKDFFSNLANWIGPKLQKAFDFIGSIGPKVVGFFTDFTGTLKRAYDVIAPIAKSIFEPIIEGVKEFFGSITSTDVSAASTLLGSAGIAGILKLLYDFRSHILRGDWSWDMVFTDPLTNTLKRIRDAVTEWQNNVKGNQLLKMAGGIAILALSLKLLSSIDADKLASGIGTIAALMTELFAAMSLFNGFSINPGPGNAQLWGGIQSGNLTGILKLSVAVLILSKAVKILSELEPEKALQGVGVVSILMTELAGVMSYLNGVDTRGVKGFLAISFAMLILGQAIKSIGNLNEDQLSKGLAGMTIALAAMSGALIAISKFGGSSLQISSAGTALLAIAAALVIMSAAFKLMGNLDGNQLSTAIAGIALGLAAMTGALVAIGQFGGSSADISASAGALLAVSVSLVILSAALKSIGSMDGNELAIGLTGIALGLAAISAALIAISSFGNTNDVGEAALSILVVSAAMGMLAPALKSLGKMSLGQLAIALAALAGSLFILGAAAVILAPYSDSLLKIGAALGAIGIGIGIAGVGVAAFSLALIALAGSMATVIAGIELFFASLPALASTIADGLGALLVAIFNAIKNSGVAFFEMIVEILHQYLEALKTLTPEFGEFVIVLVNTLCDVLLECAPRLAETGLTLFMEFLHGIRDNIEDITNTGLEILAGFLEGIANGIDNVIDAAFDVAIAFINGLGDAFRENGEEVGAAIWNLLSGAVEGILGALGELFFGLGDSIVNWIFGGEEEADLPGKTESIVKDAASAAEGKVGDFDRAGKYLGQGLANGLDSKTELVRAKAWNLANIAAAAANAAAQIKSPSRVFMRIGSYMAEGLAIGIDNMSHMAETSSKKMVDAVALNADKSAKRFGLMGLNYSLVPIVSADALNLSAINTAATINNGIEFETGNLAAAIAANQNDLFGGDILSEFQKIHEDLVKIASRPTTSIEATVNGSDDEAVQNATRDYFSRLAILKGGM